MIDEDHLYKTVRESIRNLRQSNPDSKLSQEQLGKILGLSRSAVANLETGKQRVSLYNVYALCDYLDLELSDVLPHVNEMKRVKRAEEFTSVSESLSPSVEQAILKMRKMN